MLNVRPAWPGTTKMKFTSTIIILCSALALAGCTLVPHYERPAAPVAARFPGTLTTQAAPSAADRSWRDIFPDARLQRLIEIALTNNLDLRTAILNVEQSRAQYRITRSASLPSVAGGGSFTRAAANGHTGNEWSANVGTTAYELDLFGRVRSLNQQALAAFLATVETQHSAQLALIAEIATAYFTLREAQMQLELATQTVASVQAAYALNQATFAAGASNEQDVRTAEAQVATAKINVLEYQRRVAQAQHALEPLVVQPLPADLPEPRPFAAADLVAEVPVGLPSDLLQRRPDILAAEHTLQAANASIGAARAQFFPAIKLTASLGATSSQLDQLLNASSGVWSFAPQITVPLFTGGQNRANLDAARISARIDIANYQKSIQTAFREVADALVATHNYAAELESQAVLINAQRVRFNLATARYRQGDAAYLEVLSAQQDLYSAQQSQLATQFNKLASQISLYQALGGGWQ